LIQNETDLIQYPSLVGSVGVNVFEDAKESYLKYVLKKLSDMGINDIKFSGGHLKGIDIYANGNPDKVEFTLEEKHNAFCMHLDDLTADIEVKQIYYKITKGIKFKGKMTYKIKKGLSILTCYQFTTQHYDGKLLPAINVIKSDIDINSKRAKLHI
jgi:hypothetical protein